MIWTKKYSICVACLLLLLLQCSTRHESPKDGSYQSNPFQIVLNPSQLLGKKLFFDAGLSNPAGRSCATCHAPGASFSDPEHLAVSRGAIQSRFGQRNAPTVMYAAFTPYFHYDSLNEGYVGGLFWDGRTNTLEEQAMSPLLTQHEMNNADHQMVVEHVSKAEYRDLFLSVYGADIFKNTEQAFENIAKALEEYQESAEVSPFTSKYDYYLQGRVKLSDAETRGLQIFNDTLKAKCSACHPSTPDPLTNAVLFTDFTYDNIGVPVNPDIIKPDSALHQPDLGLGAIMKQHSENGKFKVSTLRNIANTAPYFHNGIFKTLEEVLHFYNERDQGKFGAPEVPDNVNHDELGDLQLSDEEISDVVAFLKTLSDGYVVDSVELK